jgi:hypothetical protein
MGLRVVLWFVMKLFPTHVNGWDIVSELWLPTDLLFIPQVIYEYGAMLEWYWHGENQRTFRKTCPCATLSTTNPTWTDLGANPCLSSERLVTNHLSHCTVKWLLVKQVMYGMLPSPVTDPSTLPLDVLALINPCLHYFFRTEIPWLTVMMVIKSRTLKWVGYVTCVREMRNVYKILVGEIWREESTSEIFWRWNYSIKIDLK